MSTAGMGPVTRGVAAGVLALIATGCNVTPEERAAAQRAWAERHEERRAECARQGQPYFDGACVSRGGP